MLKTGIFANRWWMVVGALLGLVVNTGVIEVFTFSVFLKPISEDLGFQRETIALAGLFGSFCATFATPAFGKAIDHFGLRRVHLPMICFYALSIALLALLNTSFAMMATFFCFRGIVGSGQSPIAYSKAIAAWFDKDRGLALGIAIAGVGLGVAVMPLDRELADFGIWLARSLRRHRASRSSSSASSRRCSSCASRRFERITSSPAVPPCLANLTATRCSTIGASGR